MDLVMEYVMYFGDVFWRCILVMFFGDVTGDGSWVSFNWARVGTSVGDRVITSAGERAGTSVGDGFAVVNQLLMKVARQLVMETALVKFISHS